MYDKIWAYEDSRYDYPLNNSDDNNDIADCVELKEKYKKLKHENKKIKQNLECKEKILLIYDKFNRLNVFESEILYRLTYNKSYIESLKDFSLQYLILFCKQLLNEISEVAGGV